MTVQCWYATTQVNADYWQIQYVT